MISPTFVLVNEYFARSLGLELYHIDAYRLNSPAEFEQLGFDDLCRPDSVVLIEWADRVAGCLPRERLEVDMEVTGAQTERVLDQAIYESADFDPVGRHFRFEVLNSVAHGCAFSTDWSVSKDRQESFEAEENSALLCAVR